MGTFDKSTKPQRSFAHILHINIRRELRGKNERNKDQKYPVACILHIFANENLLILYTPTFGSFRVPLGL
jgi:hypothetical protein